MSYQAIVASIVLAAVLTAGLLMFLLLSGSGNCTEDALALADDAVTTTEDVASAASYNITSILNGGPGDVTLIDNAVSNHRDNVDALDDLQDECG